MNQPNSDVSVIIIASNEEKHIIHCLRSVIYQTMVPGETIVFVNNSTDATAELARSFIKHCLHTKIVLIEEPKLPGGIASARKQAVAYATGEIILCIDGDSFASDTWVETMRNTLLRNENRLVGSRVKTAGTMLSFFQNLTNWWQFSARGKKAAQWIWGTSFGFFKKDKADVKFFWDASVIEAERLGLSRNPEDYYLALGMSKLGNIEVTNRTFVTQRVKEKNSWQLVLRTIENVRNVKKINAAVL